ncbi:MAG TPA: DUF308 domain-containing protein [Thermoleophilia bacterium]|nr:DUF308 domain-containing protein [Thermoleophilia bacterium]
MQGRRTLTGGPSTRAMLLGMGVVLIVVGLVIVANIWESLSFLGVLIGLTLMFVGVAGVAVGAGRGGGRSLAPIVAIIGGAVLLFWPDLTLKALAVIVGLTLIVWGGVQSGIAAASTRDGRGGMLATGVLLLLLGVVVVAWPGPTLALLTTLFGIVVILAGVVTLVTGLRAGRA